MSVNITGKTKCGEWVTDRVPTEEEIEDFGDAGLILCVSGKFDNVRYDHAVVLDELNRFEDGEWYLKGVGLTGTDIVIHGWMKPPEPI